MSEKDAEQEVERLMTQICIYYQIPRELLFDEAFKKRMKEVFIKYK